MTFLNMLFNKSNQILFRKFLFAVTHVVVGFVCIDVKLDSVRCVVLVIFDSDWVEVWIAQEF